MIDAAVYGQNAELINLTKRPEHPCSSYQVSAATLGGVYYGFTGAVPAATWIGVSIHTADLATAKDAVDAPSVFAFNSVYGNWAEAKSYTPSIREPSKAYATLNEQSQRVIAGVIALPESLQAEPASSQPSSITKPLDQVSPADGYLQIDSVEPDNKGAYGLDLPLLLRPSRGPGPSFSVRYASGGATGVLGRGWDLGISSVEVRGPSPIYHPVYETEDYLLDGAELIALDGKGREIPPLYKGGPIIPRVSGERVFRLRNNSAGLIVRRHGSDPNNYFWEVWNPNSHVTRLYGGKLQDDESVDIDEASNALLRGRIHFRGGHSKLAIGQWGLSQEYDNQPARSGASYRYERTVNGERCQSATWSGDCWAALRLKSIDYNQAFGKSVEESRKLGRRVPVTGWEHGATTVLFDWEERERPRFISDGRLGFFQAQEFWLRQINVVYSAEENNRKWLSVANSTVAAMARELRSKSDPQEGVKAEAAVLQSLQDKVVFSSHTFDLGGEDAPCMNFERVLKKYSVWANPLIDGPIVRAGGTHDEMQTFTFDYAGESCTAKWSDPQNVETSMPTDIELSAPGGKLDFPAALVTDLGFDLLQQRSLLGTSRTQETGGSLYVGVGPNDGRLTSKPITGGIKGGTTFTKSESNSTLIDVTGDGLDDMLFRSGGKLRYCAGERDPANRFLMKYQRCGRIEGLADISVSDTSTLSVSAEGFAPANTFGAVGFNRSENNTYVYFTEQDGDGLIDLVSYGQVLYGQGEERPPVGEAVVRFLPKQGLIPPVPGQVAKASLQARVPSQLRETIRVIEERLAKISRKLDQLSYSQTTLSWESPLDGVVSVAGQFAFDEEVALGGAWADDFTPAKFENLPAEVKPYADYQVAKAECIKWSDENACHDRISDPFAPGYERAESPGFDFIETPRAYLQVSRFEREGRSTSICTDNVPLNRDPTQLYAVDLSGLSFRDECRRTLTGLVQDRLIRVKAGDVIHVTFSVHPHFGTRILPSVKFTYEDVDNDPVFQFLKRGKLTTGGTKEGLQKAIRCAWKDPGRAIAEGACRLAELTRYEFDLSAGALSSAPGARAVLPAGTERQLRGQFTFPDMSRQYDVFVDLLGAQTTEADLDRTQIPDEPPIKRIDATSTCNAGECAVDLSKLCTAANMTAPCSDILAEGAPHVVALRLTILHKGTQIPARDISSRLATLRWLRAPAIVSKFVEKSDPNKPNVTGKQDKTIVYVPVRMGDPDLETWRVEKGMFDNPDNKLKEDTDPLFDRIDFATIQNMEVENVEMARKRQTIDLCHFAKEIASFLEGRISEQSSPFAADFSGYWTALLGEEEEPYGKRCKDAELWLKARAFTNGDRPDESISDSLRLGKLLGNLPNEQQISSAQLLIDKVFQMLGAGEELLTDDARMTRRGYRLPAKVNPLPCEIISSAGEPLESVLTSASLNSLCSYRVLSNFAMLDFKDHITGNPDDIESWFSGFATSKEAAFELTLTATVNGVPAPFRELTGEPAGNDGCTPQPQNANTCLGAYGGPEGGASGYFFPGSNDDVFQRITVNKRTGRSIAFSNSIMQATPRDPNSKRQTGLAECKRMPDYETSSEMERKQDCVSAGATDPGLKYVGPDPSFAVTYNITEANQFIGRNRVFEFQGRPLDVVQFHFKLSPKYHPDVQTVRGETIRGKFSLFENKAGRQMIRRSAADIMPGAAKLECPAYPLPVDASQDTSARLTATCRPWTKLGWTELLLGSQYRTYSDAQRTGLDYLFTIKRRREVLRLFPEIEVDADQYSISDQSNQRVPLLDELSTSELAIAGSIKNGTKVMLSAIEVQDDAVGDELLKRIRGLQPMAGLIDLLPGVELWAVDLVATSSVEFWRKSRHLAAAYFVPSAQVQAVMAPTAFLVFDTSDPHIPKIGGAWAFFALRNDGRQLYLPRDFLKARFASDVYDNARQGKENAYDHASVACGNAEEPNFEGCGNHLAPEGENALKFSGVEQIPLIHRFSGPTIDRPDGLPVMGSVCAAELPSAEASCWQGFDDTILLESGISDAAIRQPLTSVSALLGFERPPIAEFLTELDAYKDITCLDRDWPGICPKTTTQTVASTELPPGRPEAAPSDALVEVFAPVQRSASETVSFNGGIALVNASKGRTNRTTLTAYQDVNGDGYPELISNGTAELTSPVGLPRREWWRYFRLRPGTDGLAKEIYVDGLGANATSRSTGAGIGLSPSTAALFRSHGTKNNNKSGSPDPNVEPSFEFNAETGNDTDFTELRDFNGDGLADSVRGSTVNAPLKLVYNTGNSVLTSGDGAFTAGGEPVESVFYNTSHSAGFGVRLGYSTESGSFATGMGLSHRDSGSQGALLDFTGDGRPDLVVPDGDGLIVYPNLGNGFGKARRHAIPKWNDRATGYSETTLVDGGGQFTFGFGALFVKVVFNPGIKHSRNQTRELLQIRDVNGDGMPDIATIAGAFRTAGKSLLPVLSLGDLTADVHYNPDAGYQFLSGIGTPRGSRFELRHSLFGNEGPHQGRSIWALTEVARYDGFRSDQLAGMASDGQDVLLTQYAYADGFYNRAERQFYGFAKRTSTSLGCDEDNEEPTKRNRCLETVKSAVVLTDDVLAAAGFKVLQKTDETFANRDALTQGTLLSQIVRGATSGPGDSIATALEPVSRAVFGYSIDNLQCTTDAGATNCSEAGDNPSGRWHASHFSENSALSPAWDGSTEYTDNGQVFGAADSICGSDIATCQRILQDRAATEGFDREQRTFWAQKSGSVRQRHVRLEIVAPTDGATPECDFNTDTSCTGKAALKSALGFDQDQWGQVIRFSNVAEAGVDWRPVDASSNHVTVSYALRVGPPVKTAVDLRRGYPLLGLAETVQVFDRPWGGDLDAPIRVREAVYPSDQEKYAGQGLPSSICLYPGTETGFRFEPGICRSFGESVGKALNNGQHNMQSAMKYAYEVDSTHLPVGGATTSDAVIRHQLVAYDDFGNLVHSVSPLSRTMDWIERRFSHEKDPFKTIATASEVTRCVKRESGAGADSANLPQSESNRCTFGLEKLPDLVKNVPITHYSTARIDTHSGMTAEIVDVNGNGLLYDFDRWGRLRLIARGWGNAPRENKTFATQLKRAVAKSDDIAGNPDAAPAADDTIADIEQWRLLALVDYSCMQAQGALVAENCRSTSSENGALRSNLRRFETSDIYSGLLQSGNTTRESAVFADGLGRITQTLVEADVCLEARSSLFAQNGGRNVTATTGLIARCSRPGADNDNVPGVAGVIVRPSSAIDALGRELLSFPSYAPTSELSPRSGSAMRLNRLLGADSKPQPLTRSTFDAAGRPLIIESRLAGRKPGGITGTTQYRYRIRSQGGVQDRFEALSLSPRCAASAVWTDARGLTTNVFEGQDRRHVLGADLQSGKLPTTAEYVRNLDRTAESCEDAQMLPPDWTASAVRTDYAYDSLQQLRRVDYPFPDASDTSIIVNYDLLGRTVQMQERNSGCTRYSYDALNLLTSEAGFRFELGDKPICGATFQTRNEKSYNYSADRLKSIAYHSLDEQGNVPDKADTVTFHYDRYPYASRFGAPTEADKYVLNDQANQHLIDVTGRYCDNCIGQVTLVSDRSGARTFSYNELGLVRREIRSIVGALERVVKSGGEAETNVPELAAYEVENSYSAFGDLVLEEFSESAPANPAQACVEKSVDTCLARFSIGRRYSPDGALAEMRFNGKTIVSSAQDPLGRPAVRWAANGSMTGYRYDPSDLRLNQLATLTGANQQVQMVGYQYDGDGNVLDYRNGTSAAAGYKSAFAFTYDAANRLKGFNADIMALHGGALRTMASGGEYEYDARHRFTKRSLNITEGNRTFARSWAYSYDPQKGPFHAPRSVAFSIGMVSADGVEPSLPTRVTEFRYDEIGRMTGAGEPEQVATQADVTGVISNRTMSWDGQGRLIQVRGLNDKAANDNAKWLREQYIYDAGGNRALKMHQPDVFELAEDANVPTANAGTEPRRIEAATIYMTPYYARPYNARGTVQLSISTSPAVSMAAPADESEDPLATYLYSDLSVGSMTAAVTAYGEPDNGAATFIARREYDPYGLPLTSELLAKAARPDLPSLNVFHGKELDRTTGFSSFGARYYSRDIGVWLSPDPKLDKYIADGRVESAARMTSYAFANDNPAGNTDPDGQENIFVVGAPGEHLNKLHFPKHVMEDVVRSKGRDTVIAYTGQRNEFYNSNEWKAFLKNTGTKFLRIDNKEGIIGYINSSSNRYKDKIDRFDYVGHGTPGKMYIGYGTEKDEFIRASEFKPEAFSKGARINLCATCRSAVRPFFGSSVADDFARILDKSSEIRATTQRVYFGKDGKFDRDRDLCSYSYNKCEIEIRHGSQER
nr:RHS repeat-associated core domain-containing protein [Ensifer sp. ENS04]